MKFAKIDKFPDVIKQTQDTAIVRTVSIIYLR